METISLAFWLAIAVVYGGGALIFAWASLFWLATDVLPREWRLFRECFFSRH